MLCIQHLSRSLFFLPHTHAHTHTPRAAVWTWGTMWNLGKRSRNSSQESFYGVLERVCQGPGLWCGPLGGDVAKGPDWGAVLFFFVYNQGCNQPVGVAGRHIKAVGQRQTRMDANIWLNSSKAGLHPVLCPHCQSQRTKKEARMVLEVLQQHRGQARERGRSAQQGEGGNKRSPSLPVRLLCVEGDLRVSCEAAAAAAQQLSSPGFLPDEYKC